jgi:hypothetical protein
MKAERVFHVTIHTPTETFGYNIAAEDDVQARRAAYSALQSECAERGLREVPEVQFCEVVFIVELTIKAVKLPHGVQLPPIPETGDPDNDIRTDPIA